MKKLLEYLTPKQVAELLMVSPITVRQWAQKGLLKAEITAGGHRRFFRHEIDRFARERGLTFNTQSSNKLKILVVDDDKLLTEYLIEILECYPEVDEVDAAHDGFDAGIKIISFKPDVVFLDLIMPNLDGFNVCQKLKEVPSTRAIRVIAMTGSYSEENVQRIIAYGAETCLEKPLTNKEILTALGFDK